MKVKKAKKHKIIIDRTLRVKESGQKIAAQRTTYTSDEPINVKSGMFLASIINDDDDFIKEYVVVEQKISKKHK